VIDGTPVKAKKTKKEDKKKVRSSITGKPFDAPTYQPGGKRNEKQKERKESQR